MRSVPALLLAAILLASCNVVRMAERKGEKAYRRAGLVEHTFASPQGPRHTWASRPTGKPWLLLVHGITGSGLQYAVNATELAKHYDLVAPDLIGHGKSTDTWSGNSVEEQAAHLRLILDSLGIAEAVNVVGSSYGGAMAAYFGERHPERTRLLVIYDGPANAFTKAMADSVARSFGAADILDYFSPHTPEELRRNIDAVLARPRWIPRFALRQLLRERTARQPVVEGLLRDLEDREAAFVERRYHWSMPVFVLWGAQDHLIPPAVGEGIVRVNALPIEHQVVLPDAGHIANLEVPRAFNEALLRMLATGDAPCPDASRMSEGPCSMEADPYCGCDGRTYPNRCAAWRAGVHVVRRGACE